MDYRPKGKIKNVKRLQENKEKKLCDLQCLARSFYTQHQRHHPWKKKSIKLDFIKIKNFCSEEDTVKTMKKEVIENICKSCIWQTWEYKRTLKIQQ